ncbi:type VI secretion system lipoprotein TssJ [Endozoicomonas sp. OPT23]|uniref:type VI secretion system lipoprotein TssJ n=1 Tax=Endozoicomonas sp. OPT23 TaxID=2072845 RepID=UPI00129BEDEF|nr:type VI secretion system lipoprotein TssJ [Endozoicomonas sp. OPT23]MRI32672.1 type VI secretion system lipoprotein TssJ [Endozoicomonas sp. OPT23]
MNRLRHLMMMSCLVCLTGCSVFSSGQKDTTAPAGGNLKLVVVADYDLNPNDRGEASPLKIRVYELSAGDLFEQSAFLDLYDQDSATLQDSLIKMHRIPVQYPGQTTEINLTLNTATRFIGVLAEFSRYQEADARAVGVVKPDRSHIAHLTIEGNRLFLTLKPELTVIDQAKTLWQWSKDPEATIKQKLPYLPDQKGSKDPN